MHTFDFKNRTAVVTGGAQGFGLDVAKRFLESGAKVFIWDIDEKLLKSAFDEVKNPNLFYNVVDISNYQDVEKNVADITSKSNIRSRWYRPNEKPLKSEGVPQLNEPKGEIVINKNDKLIKAILLVNL